MLFLEVAMLKLFIISLVSAAVVSSASNNSKILTFPDDSRSCEEILDEKSSELIRQELRKRYPHAVTMNFNYRILENIIDASTMDFYKKVVQVQVVANLDLSSNFPAQFDLLLFNIKQNQPCVLQIIEPMPKNM